MNSARLLFAGAVLLGPVVSSPAGNLTKADPKRIPLAEGRGMRKLSGEAFRNGSFPSKTPK